MSRHANQDSRLVRDNAQQERDARSTADADRVTDTATARSFQSRMQAMRDSEREEILPTPPDIPGYSLCWLSTTNGADSIYKRVRQGWVPVMASEIPSFQVDVHKGGEYDGIVACKEMLLYKIPKDFHMDLLSYFHHVKPNEQEESIRQKALQASHATNDGSAIGIVEEGGFKQLGAERTPVFNC